MKVVIEFNIDNTDFHDDWQREVKRVGGSAVSRLADLPTRPQGTLRAPLLGSGGDTVGAVSVEEPTDPIEQKNIEYLVQQLEDRDHQIKQLNKRMEQVEREVDGSRWGWAITRKYEEDSASLPIPRLEMSMSRRVWEDGTWTGDVEWSYYLVYRHFDGSLLKKPFGRTESNGSGQAWPLEYQGRLELPFRDGAHIHHDAELLQLPAFVRCGDRVEVLDQEDREHHRKMGREHRREGT